MGGLVNNTNIPSQNTSRVLRRSTLALNKSLERLSSGLRINRAADDAAGLAIAETFHSRVRGLAVAQRNAQEGINFVQTVEGALSEIQAMVQRMRELAIQAASSTQDATRAFLDDEVQALKSQVDTIANNTEFNGITPMAAPTTVIFQVGADQNQTITVVIGQATRVPLGLDDVNIGGTAATVQLSIPMLDGVLANLNARRAALGAAQNRFESAISTLAIEQENSASSESNIRDADIARESIAFTRNQILVSAGTSVLARSNLVPQTALQLLG